MYANKRPPSYASDVNNLSFPPPAYARQNNDYHDTSNSRSAYRRDTGVLQFIMNPSDCPARDNNDNTFQRSDTWYERMFQVNTRGYHTFANIDTKMENWSIACIAIHCLAAVILLCVSGVAIKLYQNPWNQSSVVGGATLSYALAGSVLSCVAGSLTVCLGFLTFLNPFCGMVYNIIVTLMYAAAGGLLGYGSYLTRNNNICNYQSVNAESHECYNIRLAAGWRCGIVVIAMCAINVITLLLYSLTWVIVWQIDRHKRSSRDVNQVV